MHFVRKVDILRRAVFEMRFKDESDFWLGESGNLDETHQIGVEGTSWQVMENNVSEKNDIGRTKLLKIMDFNIICTRCYKFWKCTTKKIFKKTSFANRDKKNQKGKSLVAIRSVVD